MGLRIRELRERRGLSLEKVAADLGWSHGKVSRIERGKQNSPLSSLQELATYYAVSVPELFDYDGDNPLIHIALSVPEENAAAAADILEAYLRHLRRR